MRSRNCCLLLTVLAATALLGWPGQAAATPVFYSIRNNAEANFTIIPNPPPSAPILMGISAHFLYDAATNTEGLVDIFLFELSGGNLIEQDYFEGGPLVTNGREIVATGTKFGNKLTIFFEDNFNGTANNLLSIVIQAPPVGTSPHNPCGPVFPRE